MLKVTPIPQKRFSLSGQSKLERQDRVDLEDFNPEYGYVQTGIQDLNNNRVTDNTESTDTTIKLWEEQSKKWKPSLSKISGVAFLDDKLVAADSRGGKIWTLSQERDKQVFQKIAQNVTARGVAAWSGLVAYTNTRGGKRNTVELRMSDNGQLITKWGAESRWRPWGVAVNSREQLIITDLMDNSVGVFTHYGRMVNRFGYTGFVPYEDSLKKPKYLCTDQRDRIIVSDCKNNCLKVFDRDGNYLTKVTHCNPGDKKDKLVYPRDVTTDKQSNIYVCDSGRDRIVVFSPSGNYIGATDATLHAKCAIAIDYDNITNKLAIGCNRKSQSNSFHKIKVYDMKNVGIGTA